MLGTQCLRELVNQCFLLLFALKSHFINYLLLSGYHIHLELLSLFDLLGFTGYLLLNKTLVSITLLVNCIGAGFHLLLVGLDLIVELRSTLILDILDVLLDLMFVGLSCLIDGSFHSLHVHLGERLSLGLEVLSLDFNLSLMVFSEELHFIQ